MVAFPMVNKNALRTSALLLAVVAAGHFIAYKIVHLPTQLELVILLTTAFFYPIMRKPVIGVYLLFGIMPFVSYVRRLYYLSHQRPSIDPLIAIGDIVIALTLIGLYFVFREQRAEQRNAKIMSRVVLGYFLYCIIRTFFINILPVRTVRSVFFYRSIICEQNGPSQQTLVYYSRYWSHCGHIWNETDHYRIFGS